MPEAKVFTLPDCPLAFPEVVDPRLRNKIVSSFFAKKIKYIVYTGNFHPYQGIDLLLEAVKTLKQLAAQQQSFKLLLVGGGSGEEARIKSYKAKAAALGIAEEVVFCGEFPSEAMPVFMQAADLLVSSRTTGNNVPLKIYTYLASGTLLVATDIRSHIQVLNRDNCLLAKPTPRALGEALYAGLYSISPEDRERLTATARRRGGIEQQQRFQKIVESCYDYCCNRRNAVTDAFSENC